MKLTNKKLAFEHSYKNFTIKAFWGDELDAEIIILKDNKKFRVFSYPAYRVFNLAAHFEDIVEGELENSDRGYKIAGSTGLGGCIMPRPIEREGNE